MCSMKMMKVMVALLVTIVGSTNALLVSSKGKSSRSSGLKVVSETPSTSGK